MIARIHINQFIIRRNTNQNRTDPPITVKTYLDNTYSKDVRICDDNGKEIARIIYSPDKPLSCGARLWIECDSKNVRIND